MEGGGKLKDIEKEQVKEGEIKGMEEGYGERGKKEGRRKLKEIEKEQKKKEK